MVPVSEAETEAVLRLDPQQAVTAPVRTLQVRGGRAVKGGRDMWVITRKVSVKRNSEERVKGDAGENRGLWERQEKGTQSPRV